MYYGSMAVTAVLGAAFLFLEAHEFAGMNAIGAGPSRSAFLSSFFTLVGCHGLHVTLGLLWLLTMMAQVFAKGYRADILRRILCFSLFWHTLDIIWVGIFTVVYLMGACSMSDTGQSLYLHAGDTAPGDEQADGTKSPKAWWAIWSALVWRRSSRWWRSSSPSVTSYWSGSPAFPIALFVLAIAQMGVHLVFFLHITTGPDNTNNVLALAFGVLIVFLLIVGSLWIMNHLNHNMMPMDRIMQMQR